MTINVEVNQSQDLNNNDKLAQMLQYKVKQMIGVSSHVSVLDVGGVPRSEGKAARVIDNRKL
ncbi:MAG: hypothetical protein GY808_12545 [Gammaproteobacteria bacterium]|nr:hypothetical protein [Gammaproteobacteria bacterium]